MNKIYKVVWSKAKHCYVVTSELAKRQTKGCGARSLRMATVSLGVAASLLCTGAVLPIFGESVAEAGRVKDPNSNKYYSGENIEWNGPTKSVTVTMGASVAEAKLYAFGNVSYESSGIKVNVISSGTGNVNFDVIDGQLAEIHNAPYLVITQYPSAMDGYDTNKDVSGYSITINNTSDKLLYAVYGGYSKEGNVSGNSATITNGTITNTVYGGYSGVSGNVENNNVIINGGTIGDLDNGSGAVYGAYTYNGLASNNTITINSGSTVRCPTAGSSYNGKVEENTLNINGGTIVGMAFGGVGNGTYVKSNTVNIKNDATVNATVYGGMVWGDSASDPTDVTGNTVNISDTANVNENVYGGYTYYGKVSNNTVNLNGGTVYKVYGGYTTGGAAETNHVVMNGGVVGITTSGGRTVFSGGKLNGAYSYNSSGNSGNVTGNTVTIDKGTVMADIYGGNTEAKNNKSGDAIKNIVTINGGTLAGDIYGGYSRAEGEQSGKVEGNEVNITGGVLNKAKVEINGSNVETQGVRFIYGGYTYGNNGPSESAIAYKNAVTISGGTFNNNTEVTGGYSNLYNAELNTVSITEDFTSTVGDVTGGISVYDTAKENTVTIAGGIVSNVYGGSGTVAEKNSVNITGGTVSGKVYGGHTDLGTAGGDTANDGNKVTISGGTVEGVVYGGYTYSGDAKYNSVTINKSGQVNNTVYGGYSENGGKTIGNTVTVGDSAKVTGGITAGFSPKSDAENNTVTVNNGTVSGYINGGVATGTAKENHIIINNGTVSYMQGGSGASATGNTIEVNNGTVSNTIRGGNSDAGTVSDNIVTINDGKVNGTIYGGSSNSGAVTNNKVTVTGGAINDIIWGGDSNGGDAKYNAVTISGDAKIVVEGIMGGRSWNSEATGNTVTISGGSFEPESQDPPFNTISITAGVSNANKLTAKDNVVNITGEVTGLDTAEISGYNYNVTTHSGNELHVGGTKTYDSNGTATVSSSAAWQGKSSDGTVNNKVKSVAKFESIVLHNVKWGTTLPVLEATKITNIGTLDITNMQFDQTPSNGESMALLKAGNDLGASGAGIGLAYKDGSTEKTATSAELATGVTFDSGALTDTAVNGVSVTGTQSKKVSLENSNYEIRYAFSSTISGITIATDTFTSGGTARAFGSGDNLTGATITNNLAFSDESKNSMQSGESMVILDATNAVAVEGATLPAFTSASYDVNFSDAIDGKVVTLSGTHTDTLALNSSKTQLTYTVGDMQVSGAKFDGNVTWDDSASYYTADTKYKFSGTTNVNATGLKVTGTTTNALKVGDAMTLLSAENMTASITNDQSADNKTASKITVNYNDDTTNGIALGAEATGKVAVATNAVNYEVTGVEIQSVDLAGWKGTAVDVQSETDDWTVKSGASITTGELANAGLDAMNPGDVKPILTADTTADFSVASITGNKAWQSGGTITDTDTSGVTVAGTTTGGGVKVDDTNKNVLVYQKDAKTITGVTLGSVAFTKDGTVRSFDNTYNLTDAAFTTTGFSISNAATATMNAGDTMVVVDAANAIKGTGDATLKDFTATNVGVTFTDAIEGTVLTLAGTRADTLEQNAAKTQIIFKVGDKNVETATFNGSVTWSDTAAHYTNDATKYKFNGATNIDATNLIVTGTTDKALKSGDAMTLLSAENMTASITNDQSAGNKTASKITVNYNDTASVIAMGAEATGEVKAATNAVNYEVTGVALNSVDLTNWNGTTAVVSEATAGWTVKNGASITTGNLADAGLDTMDPGDVKPILTADTTADFSVANISGNKAWQDGGTITDTDTSGVTVAGTTTGGGVKVDDTNKNVLVYQKDAKTITGITLGSVAFTKDGKVRSFDNSYNLTGADFTTTGFNISNASTATMNAGDTMVVVDAVNAIKGTGDATLKDFTTTNAGDAIAFTDQIEGKALTLSGTHQDTLEQNEAKNQILYKVGDKNVTAAIFTGEVAWNDSEAYYTNDTSKYKIAATNVDATALKVTGTSTKALQKGDALTLLSAEGMTATLAKDQSDANKTASKITVNYSDATSGIGFGAEATGAVETAVGAVNYKVTGVTMNRVDLAGWNGTTSSVPGGWAIADGATINTDGLAAPAVEPGSHVDILQNNTDNYFASATISGANTYQSTDFKDEMNGVTLEGKQDKGVTLNSEKKHLIYAAGTKNTASVSFGAVEWQKDATLADAAAGYDFTNVSEIGTDKFDVTYAKPEDVAINDSMTLLKANETLTAIVDELKTSSYKNYEIAPGVLMDGSITGTMSRSGNDVVFTATANQADKLTFTDVEWKDSGALMTRPANVMFAGADVDTAKINFHNIQELATNSRMTLVSDFGETVGTITGDTFTVGSGLKGEGAASLSGTDLVFTAKTGAESLTPTEATHETVMAMEAGTAVVAAGREYVDSAVEGLGLVSNMAPDGTSTFASMGGGVGRYKTGSHVDTHTWNAVVAVGSKREHKKGSLEWGVFAEYGRGNYTLHDDNGGRGDGNTHYAGGGLLAKWTNKHDVYTEASFRMGRMSDSASNMLRDVLGNTYGYDVHANYFGGHVGLGKIYKVKGNKDLDVYGKFFYTRRNGVDFDAGGNHYSLDSVASKLLRIGARYGSNDRKWNWYGGLAYEYEFGGESKGTVDGLAIRSASIKGASVRGEIGVRLEATKTNPWKADISIYGYGGKHRGIGGTVSVAYMF